MGSYAIIGAHLCIANGAAWSAQIRGTDQVAVAFFGDGTTNIGAFHEALNLAAVWKLPTVFVCENNLYMEYTPIDLVTAVPTPPPTGPGRTGWRRSWSTATTPTPSYRRRPDALGRRPGGRRPGRWSRRSPTATAVTPGPTPASTGRPPRSRRGWRTIRSPSTTGGCCGSGSPRTGSTGIERQVADEIDAATEFAKAAPEPDQGSLFTDVWADGGSRWRN